MTKTELLLEINKIISIPSSNSSNIELGKSWLLDYLKENDEDWEMWFKLSIMQLIPPLMDTDSAIRHLKYIWNNSKNVKSIIYIAIIQDMHFGFVEESTFNLLIEANNQKKEKLLLAMIKYCLGLFFKNSDFASAEFYFKQSIDLCPMFVNAHSGLGYIYKKRNMTLSKEFYFKAVQNIKRINSVNEILQNNNDDWLSLIDFEEEIILGNCVTEPKYEYIISLC